MTSLIFGRRETAATDSDKEIGELETWLKTETGDIGKLTHDTLKTWQITWTRFILAVQHGGVTEINGQRSSVGSGKLHDEFLAQDGARYRPNQTETYANTQEEQRRSGTYLTQVSIGERERGSRDDKAQRARHERYIRWLKNTAKPALKEYVQKMERWHELNAKQFREYEL